MNKKQKTLHFSHTLPLLQYATWGGNQHMSGPKAADVRPKLRRAVEAVNQLMQESAKNADRLRNLGTADLRNSEKMADTLQRSMNATNIPPAVSQYAPEDAAQLSRQKQEADTLIATGEREAKRADDLRREAESLQSRSRQMMDNVRRTTDDVSRRLDRSTGHYMHAEDRMATQARQDAQTALQIEKQAADKLRDALDHGRRAKNAFDSAIAIGNRFTQNVSNIQRIATERESAAKIAEENQRRASTSNSEIGGLTEAINSLSHAKFAPGEFQTFSSDIESFRRAFSSQNFAEAAKTGEGLAARLRTFEQKVSSLQTAFETAQIAAQNALASASEEIAPLDRNELIRWSGEDAAVAGAYSRLETAAGMLASEQFAEAETAAAASLEELRRIARTAEENKVASEQRYALAEVIMNALYEQGYDSPTYYYMQKKPDGSDVEFSDLAIFAKAPGDRGDMRMNINLEGKVNLEVENIAEGEEGVCVELIQNLQKGVGDEIDFQMTDWGRGSNANPQAKVAVQTQMQTQEITRQRQG